MRQHRVNTSCVFKVRENLVNITYEEVVSCIPRVAVEYIYVGQAVIVTPLIRTSSNHNYSLHTQRIFHKTYSILTELPLTALSCQLYHHINALEGECLSLREISINIYKVFIVICVFYLRYPCSVVAHLFVYSLLPLFIDHVKESNANSEK